jgi:hypothetical protein
VLIVSRVGSDQVAVTEPTAVGEQYGMALPVRAATELMEELFERLEAVVAEEPSQAALDELARVRGLIWTALASVSTRSRAVVPLLTGPTRRGLALPVDVTRLCARVRSADATASDAEEAKGGRVRGGAGYDDDRNLEHDGGGVGPDLVAVDDGECDGGDGDDVDDPPDLA